MSTMAGWGFSLESLKSKVQEAGEKVAMRAMPRAPDACAERCRPGNGLVSAQRQPWAQLHLGG